MQKEIRIAGTGGMGVVLAGVIVGHSAVVYGGLNAVQSQSYGSEARGTAAKSEVIIGDGDIHFPKVRKSDYFVVMSQSALDKYIDDAKLGSLVIVDPDLVDTTGLEEKYELIDVPAMKTADNMGVRLASNMVMLGALVKKSGLFPLDALENGVKDMVPEKYLEIDVKAIHAGADLV